jgi:hypothetical protein
VFEAIDEASLAFSPDGRRLAYAGRRDGKWYAVIDGAEGIGYESVGRPAFSGDGSRAGHVGRREGKDVVVLDGKEAAVHDAVHPNSLTFSFDGGRVGYVTGPPRGVAVVVDEAEGLP